MKESIIEKLDGLPEPALKKVMDYVLDEWITLLFRRENHDEASWFLDGLLADCARGRIQVQRMTAERFQAALDLQKHYRHKPNISFTDFTTMSMMRELRIAAVVTEDSHFLQVGLGFQILLD